MVNESNPWIGDTYPEPLRIGYIITGLLYFIFGVSGNVLIIVSIMKVKSLRNYSNAFIVNIAASDLLFAGYVLPITLVDLLQGSYPTPSLCVFNGGLYRMLGLVSILGKMFIAVNRFYKICRPALYQVIFKRRNVILMCSSGWIFGGLNVSILWITGTQLCYDPRIHLCGVFVVDSTIRNIAYFCFSFICISIALFCYARVYRKVKTSVDVFTSTYPQIAPHRFCQNAMDTVRTNCIIFIVYILFITPDIYLTNIEVKNVIMRGIAANLRFAGTGISFIMYGAFNNSISRAYKELLCSSRCKCRKQTTDCSVSMCVNPKTNKQEYIFQTANAFQKPAQNIVHNSI